MATPPALVAAPEPPATPDNIFHAIHAGDPARVKKLLDANPKLVSHENNWGVTPLHAAAELYSPEVVKLLLDAGADVNEKRGDSEYTPLHGAVRLGSKEVVAFLLARGAGANASPCTGRPTADTWRSWPCSWSKGPRPTAAGRRAPASAPGAPRSTTPSGRATSTRSGCSSPRARRSTPTTSPLARRFTRRWNGTTWRWRDCCCRREPTRTRPAPCSAPCRTAGRK